MALSEEDRTNLVAFLDGELDEAAAQALEAKLAGDPSARAEAEALKRTWELLDYLPRTEASQSFTHRTLERLAVQTSPSRSALQVPLPQRQRAWLPAAVAAAVLLAAGGGALAARLLWPPPMAQQQPAATPAPSDEQMARNLRVIENRRLYEHVDDIEFLRQLDDPDLFGDDLAW